MMKFLAPVVGVVVAAPAHAVSIVSLHGGMGVPMANPTGDVVLLLVGVATLAAVVAFRVLRRKVGEKQ